jgi:cytoskeletal protein CcmA (bactofilin family)
MFEIGKRNKPVIDRPDTGKRSLRDSPTSQPPGLLSDAGTSGSWAKDVGLRRLPGDEAGTGQQRKESGYISASMTIEGSIHSQEDLIIDGQVRGSIDALDNTVTVAARGRVEADIKAHTVVINGNFSGDVYAGELIAVRHTALVSGNLRAPRISVEDGARLRGNVTMEDHDAGSPFVDRTQVPALEQKGGEAPAGMLRDVAGWESLPAGEHGFTAGIDQTGFDQNSEQSDSQNSDGKS